MRGKAKKLTDVSKLKWKSDGPERQQHWDAECPGLLVRVYPAPGDARATGRRSFYVRYDQDGKQRFKLLGQYPELDLLTARRLASEVRAKAKAGLPTESTTTVTVADAWKRIQVSPLFTRYARSTKAALAVNFDKHIQFKSQPVLDVSAEHWLGAIDAALEAGLPGTANGIRTLAGCFYKGLQALPGFRTVRNPLTGIHIYIPPSKTKEAIPLALLKTLKLDDPVCHAAMSMLRATGLRLNEVIRMKWTDIDNDIWVVGSVGEMKRRGSAHHLPMTGYMWSILEPMKAYGSEWCFPGLNGHLHDSTLGKHLKAAYPGVTPHYLRHSFASICADHDIDPYGVSLCLHHSIRTETHQTYIHSQHIERKRAVLEAYQALLG